MATIDCGGWLSVMIDYKLISNTNAYDIKPNTNTKKPPTNFLHSLVGGSD